MTAILKYEQRTHNMQFDHLMYCVKHGLKMCVCVDYVTNECGSEKGIFETNLYLTVIRQDNVENIEKGNYVKFNGESKKEFFDKIFSVAYKNMRAAYPSMRIENIKTQAI